MKKLLLLLFLIPNLVMAENLMLICEGDKIIKIGEGEESLHQDKIAAIINDKFIEWDGRKFIDRDYQPTDELGNSHNGHYFKDDKEIIFWDNLYKASGYGISIKGNINRLTGEFHYQSSLHKPDIFTVFYGSCKKRDKAF